MGQQINDNGPFQGEKIVDVSGIRPPITVALYPGGGLLGSQRRSAGSAAASWVRHPDWLPLPAIGPTEEKFIGLFGVTDDSANFVALLAQGDYTVDWGDGTVETHDSFTVASHQYDYASVPANTLSSRGYKQVIVTVTPREWTTFTRIGAGDIMRFWPPQGERTHGDGAGDVRRGSGGVV